MTADPFRVASDALSDFDGQVSDLARPFTSFLPVSGASVSTFGTLLSAETVSATDERAGRIDELQFDLGEGPCWDALSTRRPILEPDVARSSEWPVFTKALLDEEVGAIFAFPLALGPLEIGAVDLYSSRPISLTPAQQQQAVALSAIVSRILLRHAVADGAPSPSSTFSRRLIHQATGMVLAQLETTPEDAYLIIQARAFSDNRTMREIAEDIIDRRIAFSALENPEGP